MLLVLSPAKTLDFSPAPPTLPATLPEMAKDTAALARVARRLRRADLMRLMGVSDKLADLNVERFQAFHAGAAQDGVQAALAFAGDVYDGLDARRLDADALDWAQAHLRILSGLYGLLRPLDRIQPYRLEMGVRLHTKRGDSLYEFWGDRLAKALNRAAAGQADRTLVNLASVEYFGGVDRQALKLPLVSCQFKEEGPDGGLRIVSFYAKKARGLMARYAIETRADRATDLKAFDLAGYRFRPEASSDDQWIFSRLKTHD